ncbi:hypothetical protein OSTOST_16147 [Ostertagia ostertagi]
MAFNEMNDMEYYTRLMTNPHQSWSSVQQDLDNTQELLRIELKVADAYKEQWNWTRNDETFVLATPAAKFIILSKLLHKIHASKHDISRLGVRVVSTQIFYRSLGDDSTERTFEKEVQENLKTMDIYTKQLSSLMKEIETYMKRAENDFRTGPCSTNAEQINALFRRAFETLTMEDKDKTGQKIIELQTQLNIQSEELARMKEELAKRPTSEPTQAPVPMEVEMTDNEYFDRMINEVNEVEQPPELVSEESDEDERKQAEVHMIVRVEDQEQSDRVVVRVDESQQEEKEAVVRVEQVGHQERVVRVEDEEHGRRTKREEREDSEIEELKNQCRYLEQKVDFMHDVVRKFPYRKKEFVSPGMRKDRSCAFCKAEGQHFSDSCPHYVDGDERYEMMIDEGVCRYCLERDKCNYDNTCPYAYKECFYCSRLEGTPFEYMIIKDGHHTALCNIPNRKHEARTELDKAREELREVMTQLARRQIEQGKRQDYSTRARKERDEEAERRPRDY